MSNLIAIYAKDLGIKDKDKCQKSRDKYVGPNLGLACLLLTEHAVAGSASGALLMSHAQFSLEIEMKPRIHL